MRIIILLIVAMLSLISRAQDQKNLRTLSVGFEIGLSHLSPKDLSYASPSLLENIDNRVVPNFGVKLTYNIRKKRTISPRLTIGLNSFTNKATGLDTSVFNRVVEFKNTLFSWNAEASICYNKLAINDKPVLFYLGINMDKEFMLRPFALLTDGEKINEMYESKYVNSRSFYNGPITIGPSLGTEMQLSKLRIGLFYYHRIWFTGFNREISRLTLRVSF